MKLSEEDKIFLFKIGYLKEDLPQIEEAIRKCSYDYTDKRSGVCKSIRPEEARKILGDKVFLGGIARAAFHWTCGRESGDGIQYIHFDCRKLFR